jgi:hypothetical protein
MLCGESSTATSGGTPSFSTIQPSSGDQPPMFGAVIGAAVHQRVNLQVADQSAPGARTDDRTELRFAEHPRQQVAAGAGAFVDDHHLRSVDCAARRAQILP